MVLCWFVDAMGETMGKHQAPEPIFPFSRTPRGYDNTTRAILSDTEPMVGQRWRRSFPRFSRLEKRLLMEGIRVIGRDES